ncbi:histidinol-phosphate transaminase [Desulfosporosinus youngiae]|uniref:Histidinol-phosphate aminotransferase n=1 Tax=Desulfosporosinus youngiae DSM 17734 TaxID=768710 RepID=H5Y623_9FIRM|nr:histidinol-phosphate transaminase [Desulfosporosinus youngiae]EHQ90962.1 histidinol-phosphate aminotransferase [Desulfosporosinus youngiae DSM 17734]
MNINNIVRKVYPKLTPYKCKLADLPVEEIKAILGKETVYKLSFNESPLSPSPKAIQAMTESLGKLNLYPSSSGDPIMKKIAEIEGVGPEQVILSNGADEMIILIAQTFLEPEDEVIIPKLSFIQYLAATNLMGATPVFSQMNEDLSYDLDDILSKITSKTKVIFLCNPNNPTGTIMPKHELVKFLSKVPEQILVVIDEAYQEYAGLPEFESGVRHLNQHRFLFVVRTFSKAYSLAGARLGYGIGTPEVIAAINHVRPPFNVNAVVQAGALASLDDFEHLQKAKVLNDQGKQLIYEAAESLGLPYLKSYTNFVYIDTKIDSDLVFEKLAEYGVIVRTLKGYGLDTSIRVSVGKQEEVLAFVESFKEIMLQA